MLKFNSKNESVGAFFVNPSLMMFITLFLYKYLNLMFRLSNTQMINNLILFCFFYAMFVSVKSHF